MRLIRAMGVAMTLLTAAKFAGAAAFCVGTVSQVGIGQGGAVSVTLSSGVSAVTICSLTNATLGFTLQPAECKAAYAGLLSAKAAATQARIYYSDQATCSGVAAWSTQKGTYFIEFL